MLVINIEGTMEMTFEERMRQKQRSGYDKIDTKEEVLLRKEKAQKV